MDILLSGARALGVELSPAQADRFARYQADLIDWNTRVNLTAIKDPEGVQRKHFLDSLTCLQVLPPGPLRLIDVGTGAGFPGVPLKILYPGMRLTLVESVGKKAMFCEHIVRLLGLEGVEVIQARAEQVGCTPEHREQHDWAVARAVAHMNVLSEYLLPLVRVGGTMLAQKGESGPAETQAAEKAIKLLGGKLRQVIPVNLPGVVDDRFLILIDKSAATPPKYPRKPGLPVKRPL